MILTLDNSVALSSDGEGLRSTPGNIGETTEGGLFSQILSSQETVSIPADESAGLLPLIGQDSASGTLLPADGKALPALEGSEIELANLELAVSLQAPVGEALIPTPLDPSELQPVNGGLIEGIEKVVSPPLLAQRVTSQPIALDSDLEQRAVSIPKAVDVAAELGQKIPAPPNTGNEASELLARNPIAVAASITPPQIPLTATGARKPTLPLQELGQKVELAAKSDVAATTSSRAAGQSAVPLVQKPEIAGVFEDALAESSQSLKVADGVSTKSAVANTPSGTQALPSAMSQNATDLSLSSNLKATSVTTLPTPVSDPNWNQEFVGRIGVMVEKGISEAKLQLTPAELGRMEVKISTDGDQTKILFTVQNAPAREAIEQAMPRLREMLGQEGLQLAHSEVADHSAARDDSRNFSGAELATDSGIVDEELDEFLPRSVPLGANTMVDYYV